LGDFLYAGVNSDKDVLETKGPSLLNCKERCEIIKHCKFVDKVIPDAPYALRKDFVEEIGCDFWAHGDDPCIDKSGVDVCQYFRD
jgi:choline-phosphate cytidylyltransferase